MFPFHSPVPWCHVGEADGCASVFLSPSCFLGFQLQPLGWLDPDSCMGSIRGHPAGPPRRWSSWGATLGRPPRHCIVSIQRAALPSTAALQPLETTETSRPRRRCLSSWQLAMLHWHQLPSRLLFQVRKRHEQQHVKNSQLIIDNTKFHMVQNRDWMIEPLSKSIQPPWTPSCKCWSCGYRTAHRVPSTARALCLGATAPSRRRRSCWGWRCRARRPRERCSCASWIELQRHLANLRFKRDHRDL